LVPFILLFNGYRDSFPRVKQEEHRINHSPLSRTEAKNEWNCTSALPVHLYGMDWDKFTFTRHKLQHSSFYSLLDYWAVGLDLYRVKRVFSSPKHADSRDRRVSPWRVEIGVKWEGCEFHQSLPVLWLKTCGANPPIHLPIHHHGMTLN